MTRRNTITLALLAATLGLNPAIPSAFAQGADATEAQAPHVFAITVEGGYHPDRLVATEGERVQLRFLRRDYGACTREVVFPTLGLRVTLPTNEPVLIDLGAPAAGEIPFHCGMNMIHGSLVVQAGGGAR